MSSPRASFPVGVLALQALCGAAWPALVVLWTWASWQALGDVEAVAWAPRKHRSLTQAIAAELGHEGDAGRRTVARWLDALDALGLIIKRDGRRAVLAPVMDDRNPVTDDRADPVTDDREPVTDDQHPVTDDREPVTDDRPSDLILSDLPVLVSQSQGDAREADIEATIAWCAQPADRGAMPAGEASARDTLALQAGTSEAWCSGLRVAMRDGLTRAEVERIIGEHARQSAAAASAGTLQAMHAANANGRARDLGIPAPSRLWAAWSKTVEWRAAALGHVTEARPARASGRVEARSGTGRHERASERLRAELAGGKAR